MGFLTISGRSPASAGSGRFLVGFFLIWGVMYGAGAASGGRRRARISRVGRHPRGRRPLGAPCVRDSEESAAAGPRLRTPGGPLTPGWPDHLGRSARVLSGLRPDQRERVASASRLAASCRRPVRLQRACRGTRVARLCLQTTSARPHLRRRDSLDDAADRGHASPDPHHHTGRSSARLPSWWLQSPACPLRTCGSAAVRRSGRRRCSTPRSTPSSWSRFRPATRP